MPSRRLKALLTAGSVWCAVLASGCGFDGVELQGGVFDMLGVSSNTQQRKQEPKVAARPGLVLPPVADRLPEPSAEPNPLAAAWPDDEDGRKVRVAAELDRQHEEFCRKALLNAKINNDLSPINGPKGPCTTSLLRSLTDSVNK